MEPTWNTCLQTLVGHKLGVQSVAFSADGRWLASASTDGTARIWDPTTGSCVLTLYHETAHVGQFESDQLYSTVPKVGGAVAFAAHRCWLAWGSPHGTVRIWDLATRTCLHTMKGHETSVLSVDFSRDSSKIASASFDNTARIWDATRGVCLHTLRDNMDLVFSVAFLADDRLATASNDGAVRIWDAAKGECVKILRDHDEWLCSLASSPDGRRLVSTDTKVHFWDIATGDQLLNFVNDDDQPHLSVAFSADGRLIATGCVGKIDCWDANDGALIQTLQGPDTVFMSLAFSPDADARRLVSASDDWIVRVWDISTMQAYTSESHHARERAGSIFLSADGRMFATASSPDSTIKIWSASTGHCLQTFGHKGEIRDVTFSADNLRLASTSSSCDIKIWNTETGHCVQTIDDFDSNLRSGALIANGEKLASASSGLIKIWDMATGNCLHTFGNRKKKYSHAFVKASTGGEWLAYGFDRETFRIWNTVNDFDVLPLESHGYRMDSIAFSADDRLLASASSEALKIWDVETGTCVQTITNHLHVLGDSFLSFETNHRTHLHTRFGFLDLGLLPERTPREDSTEKVCYRGYGIDDSQQEVWILRDGERLLRIPPDHVPLLSAFASCMNGSVFVWVSFSGRVLRMRVSTREYNL